MKRRFRFPLWAKTLIVMAFTAALIIVTAVVFSSLSLVNVTRNHYVEHSIEVADTYALFLDTDDVKAVQAKTEAIYQAIPEEEKVDNTHWGEDEWTAYLARFDEVVAMPEYGRVMAQTSLFHSKNDAKNVYIAYADFAYSRIVYLVDDAPIEDRCLPGSFDAFTESDMRIFDHPEEGFPPEITNTPEYGYLVAVGRPVYDENGNIVSYAMIELSMDAITAKEQAEVNKMAWVLATLGALATLLGFFLVVFLIIRPMRKLTKVANEYTYSDKDGFDKFNHIKIRTADEIEDLANSMKKMEGNLNQFIADLTSTKVQLHGAEAKADELERIADIDALTGVGNKRAYYEAEEKINAAIRAKEDVRFSISMIDLNDLKEINDTQGHDSGDDLIVALSNIIKGAFPDASIYRIGGDEFAVIYEGDLAPRSNASVKRFAVAMNESKSGARPVSAAIGMVHYDARIDNNVEDALKRADAKMYENKRALKRARKG